MTRAGLATRGKRKEKLLLLRKKRREDPGDLRAGGGKCRLFMEEKEGAKKSLRWGPSGSGGIKERNAVNKKGKTAPSSNSGKRKTRGRHGPRRKGTDSLPSKKGGKKMERKEGTGHFPARTASFLRRKGTGGPGLVHRVQEKQSRNIPPPVERKKKGDPIKTTGRGGRGGKKRERSFLKR